MMCEKEVCSCQPLLAFEPKQSRPFLDGLRQRSFYFEKFELRPTERKLFNDGKDIALGSRAFDMLCFLVENRQRFLSKAEILDAIWPDISVEESNLTVQISALRKALGAKALVTIPGRGYQFVLSVEEEAQSAISK